MTRRLSGPLWLEFSITTLIFLILLTLGESAPYHETTDLQESSSSEDDGCYHNFNHYKEGNRIATNEPCLNCTCHNSMLMCYLRVCPFTKPIDEECIVEQREDQCCPIITCPEVPVKLIDHHGNGSHHTDLADPHRFGCTINSKYYPEGAQVPTNPKKPCELCYCIRNMTSCVMQECTLHIDGCRPIYNKGVCCPVRYACEHDYDDSLLLEDLTTATTTTTSAPTTLTTDKPTPGFILPTTISPFDTDGTLKECLHHGETYFDGAHVETDKPCQHCYCMRGTVICVVNECPEPLENRGKHCVGRPPKEGKCCPDTYDCDELETTQRPNITKPVLIRDDSEEVLSADLTTSIDVTGTTVIPTKLDESKDILEHIDDTENEIHLDDKTEEISTEKEKIDEIVSEKDETGKVSTEKVKTEEISTVKEIISADLSKDETTKYPQYIQHDDLDIDISTISTKLSSPSSDELTTIRTDTKDTTISDEDQQLQQHIDEDKDILQQHISHDDDKDDHQLQQHIDDELIESEVHTDKTFEKETKPKYDDETQKVEVFKDLETVEPSVVGSEGESAISTDDQVIKEHSTVEPGITLKEEGSTDVLKPLDRDELFATEIIKDITTEKPVRTSDEDESTTRTEEKLKDEILKEHVTDETTAIVKGTTDELTLISQHDEYEGSGIDEHEVRQPTVVTSTYPQETEEEEYVTTRVEDVEGITVSAPDIIKHATTIHAIKEEQDITTTTISDKIAEETTTTDTGIKLATGDEYKVEDKTEIKEETTEKEHVKEDEDIKPSEPDQREEGKTRKPLLDVHTEISVIEKSDAEFVKEHDKEEKIPPTDQKEKDVTVTEKTEKTEDEIGVYFPTDSDQTLVTSEPSIQKDVQEEEFTENPATVSSSIGGEDIETHTTTKYPIETVTTGEEVKEIIPVTYALDERFSEISPAVPERTDESIEIEPVEITSKTPTETGTGKPITETEHEETHDKETRKPIDGENLEREKEPFHTDEFEPITIIPHSIPGEGDCLVEGVSYPNNSTITPTNKCQTLCICINSVVSCERVECKPLIRINANCKESFDGCCPVVNCDDDKEVVEGTTTTIISEESSEIPAVIKEIYPDKEIPAVIEEIKPTDITLIEKDDNITDVDESAITKETEITDDLSLTTQKPIVLTDGVDTQQAIEDVQQHFTTEESTKLHDEIDDHIESTQKSTIPEVSSATVKEEIDVIESQEIQETEEAVTKADIEQITEEAVTKADAKQTSEETVTKEDAEPISEEIDVTTKKYIEKDEHVTETKDESKYTIDASESEKTEEDLDREVINVISTSVPEHGEESEVATDLSIDKVTIHKEDKLPEETKTDIPELHIDEEFVTKKVLLLGDKADEEISTQVSDDITKSVTTEKHGEKITIEPVYEIPSQTTQDVEIKEHTKLPIIEPEEGTVKYEEVSTNKQPTELVKDIVEPITLVDEILQTTASSDVTVKPEHEETTGYKEIKPSIPFDESTSKADVQDKPEPEDVPTDETQKEIAPSIITEKDVTPEPITTDKPHIIQYDDEFGTTTAQEISIDKKDESSTIHHVLISEEEHSRGPIDTDNLLLTDETTTAEYTEITDNLTKIRDDDSILVQHPETSTGYIDIVKHRVTPDLQETIPEEFSTKPESETEKEVSTHILKESATTTEQDTQELPQRPIGTEAPDVYAYTNKEEEPLRVTETASDSDLTHKPTVRDESIGSILQEHGQTESISDTDHKTVTEHIDTTSLMIGEKEPEEETSTAEETSEKVDIVTTSTEIKVGQFDTTEKGILEPVISEKDISEIVTTKSKPDYDTEKEHDTNLDSDRTPATEKDHYLTSKPEQEISSVTEIKSEQTDEDRVEDHSVPISEEGTATSSHEEEVEVETSTTSKSVEPHITSDKQPTITQVHDEIVEDVKDVTQTTLSEKDIEISTGKLDETTEVDLKVETPEIVTVKEREEIKEKEDDHIEHTSSSVITDEAPVTDYESGVPYITDVKDGKHEELDTTTIKKDEELDNLYPIKETVTPKEEISTTEKEPIHVTFTEQYPVDEIATSVKEILTSDKEHIHVTFAEIYPTEEIDTTRESVTEYDEQKLDSTTAKFDVDKIRQPVEEHKVEDISAELSTKVPETPVTHVIKIDEDDKHLIEGGVTDEDKLPIESTSTEISYEEPSVPVKTEKPIRIQPELVPEDVTTEKESHAVTNIEEENVTVKEGSYTSVPTKSPSDIIADHVTQLDEHVTYKSTDTYEDKLKPVIVEDKTEITEISEEEREQPISSVPSLDTKVPIIGEQKPSIQIGGVDTPVEELESNVTDKYSEQDTTIGTDVQTHTVEPTHEIKEVQPIDSEGTKGEIDITHAPDFVTTSSIAETISDIEKDQHIIEHEGTTSSIIVKDVLSEEDITDHTTVRTSNKTDRISDKDAITAIGEEITESVSKYETEQVKGETVVSETDKPTVIKQEDEYPVIIPDISQTDKTMFGEISTVGTPLVESDTVSDITHVTHEEGAPTVGEDVEKEGVTARIPFIEDKEEDATTISATSPSKSQISEFEEPSSTTESEKEPVTLVKADTTDKIHIPIDSTTKSPTLDEDYNLGLTEQEHLPVTEKEDQVIISEGEQPPITEKEEPNTIETREPIQVEGKPSITEKPIELTTDNKQSVTLVKDETTDKQFIEKDEIIVGEDEKPTVTEKEEGTTKSEIDDFEEYITTTEKAKLPIDVESSTSDQQKEKEKEAEVESVPIVEHITTSIEDKSEITVPESEEPVTTSSEKVKLPTEVDQPKEKEKETEVESIPIVEHVTTSIEDKSESTVPESEEHVTTSSEKVILPAEVESSTSEQQKDKIEEEQVTISLDDKFGEDTTDKHIVSVPEKDLQKPIHDIFDETVTETTTIVHTYPEIDVTKSPILFDEEEVEQHIANTTDKSLLEHGTQKAKPTHEDELQKPYDSETEFDTKPFTEHEEIVKFDHTTVSDYFTQKPMTVIPTRHTTFSTTTTTEQSPPHYGGIGDSGYGQGTPPIYPTDDEYIDEDEVAGPGACRYGGKIFVSAQQIPRDDPCDFCFCFRGDIICLQQSCPPPIARCHEEPILGFCCPRYECPVSMATVMNLTTSTTTTTTVLPPHFLHHAYKGAARKSGCLIEGTSYQIGDLIKHKSGPCMHCICGGDGQMQCDPRVCTPEPMLRQMMGAVATSRRR